MIGDHNPLQRKQHQKDKKKRRLMQAFVFLFVCLEFLESDFFCIRLLYYLWRIKNIPKAQKSTCLTTKTKKTANGMVFLGCKTFLPKSKLDIPSSVLLHKFRIFFPFSFPFSDHNSFSFFPETEVAASAVFVLRSFGRA